MFKMIAITMASIIAIIVLSFGTVMLDLSLMEFFGVRRENVKREIFEQSKSHVHGTIKNLSRLQLEYKIATNEAHKMAIKEMILMESSTFDVSKLPHNLQTFIRSL